MENEDQFIPVTDNSLLPFGQYRIARDTTLTKVVDIRPIFEDGLTIGNATYDYFRVSGSGVVTLHNFPVGSTENQLEGWGEMEIFRGDFSSGIEWAPDEDAGVFIDLNEERDSVILTWNKIGIPYPGFDEKYSFQAEYVDEGNGNAEVILRYLETHSGGGARVFPFDSGVIGGYGLQEFMRPVGTLDTRIGNTGVAGVYQFNLVDGQVVGDTIIGTDADDTLEGTVFSDVIDGGAGNDTINARTGNDVVRGGEGNDFIESTGYGDDNLIDGGTGNDTIRTGERNDTIMGGEGDDLINAGFGYNVISGGDGNDIIRFGYRGGSTVDAGTGDDWIDGSFLNDQQPGWYVNMPIATNEINGGDGNDTILGTNNTDIIGGQLGNDSVLAGGGDDRIFGGDGNDILTAGQGNDVIDGGAGDDFIFGALGNDTATGGEGADRFFNSGQRGDVLHIMDYNRDEGDFLVVDGDLFDRAQFALRYEVTATEAGTDIAKLRVGIMEQDNFRALFTFGNEADLDEVLLRLPADEGDAVAPILFDLGDLIA